MSCCVDPSSISLLFKYSSTEVVEVLGGILDGFVQVHGVVVGKFIRIDVLFVGYCFFKTIKMLFDLLRVLSDRQSLKKEIFHELKFSFLVVPESCLL
jgi:hypothetical protein